MGNIWDRYKGAESGEGVETIEAGLRASQIGVDLTEEEQKILKEPEEKARQQASDQLQRALDGQGTPTMGNGLVEAARMRNEAAQDGGKGKKKKKSDAAMQLLLAQLSDFQAQIDWYDGEIERLRNEADEHNDTADEMAARLVKLDELDPDSPEYKAILDRHGVSNREELEEMMRREREQADQKNEQADKYQEERDGVQRRRDELIERNPELKDLERALRRDREENLTTTNASVARSVARSEPSDNITEEQQEVAFGTYSDAQKQHDDSQVSFDGFGEFGSFASTLDKTANDPSIKEEFEIAATGTNVQGDQPEPGQTPNSIPTNQMA